MSDQTRSGHDLDEGGGKARRLCCSPAATNALAISVVRPAALELVGEWDDQAAVWGELLVKWGRE